jgi:hypothetical protein
MHLYLERKYTNEKNTSLLYQIVCNMSNIDIYGKYSSLIYWSVYELAFNLK